MWELVKDFSGEVETNMNEGDKVFARESAVLYECIERARRALLDDPDERKQNEFLRQVREDRNRL